ncbi:hypothetical protein L1887_51317 [Cichorium endivia]|nr:hypothetical protein L1887_51317 [Cichorium endivia]
MSSAPLPASGTPEVSQLPILASDDKPSSISSASDDKADEKASTPTSEKVSTSTSVPLDSAGEPVEPLRGEKVIRNGRDVSDYLISDRDDGDACFTFRSVTLGLVGAAFQAVLTQIYRFKPTEVTISGTFLAIIIYILGTAWARILPTRKSLTARFGNRLPEWVLATAHFINPGKFGLKEHAIASITASSASNGAHSSDVFGTQKLFYPDIPVTTTTAVLSVLSIGLFGYGLAGIFRPFSVYPAEMVYWSTLPLVDLFQAFHWDESFSARRTKAFWWSFGGMGLYEILPSYIFPTLNSISIPCFASNARTQAHPTDADQHLWRCAEQRRDGLAVDQPRLAVHHLVADVAASDPAGEFVDRLCGVLHCHGGDLLRQRVERKVVPVHVDQYLFRLGTQVQPDGGVCERRFGQGQARGGWVSECDGHVCVGDADAQCGHWRARHARRALLGQRCASQSARRSQQDPTGPPLEGHAKVSRSASLVVPGAAVHLVRLWLDRGAYPAHDASVVQLHCLARPWCCGGSLLRRAVRDPG